MINWVLEVDGVEDVAWIVDDMDGTNRSRTLVQRGWSNGKVERGLRVRAEGRVLEATTRLSGCSRV